MYSRIAFVSPAANQNKFVSDKMALVGWALRHGAAKRAAVMQNHTETHAEEKNLEVAFILRPG
jgi:hypothetical protein